MKKIIFLLAMAGLVFSLPYWTTEDFERAELMQKGSPVMPPDVVFERGDWQSWSYIHELIQTAAFIAVMQVSDSLDPEYGGIIEGEDALTIVETDNTQEAIWVWCRYYELTGDTSYNVNLRRAWFYIMNFPAYLEEGTESDYYRVWNCGLALFAESKYRQVYSDSSYRQYADTCAKYMSQHPLPFSGPTDYYRRLHPKTTSLAAGMLYQYGKDLGNQVFQDTALVYGSRVKTWIEASPDTNINDEIWAMSGGTAVWGLCRSIFDSDTAAGIAWLNAYLPFMKYYQPTGTWNNSWNIWYANAYDRAARITGSTNYGEYHHGLTDSLLVQDYDDDGGVPPTRGWGANQDHAWVSSYMFFMGFDKLLDSVKNHDAAASEIIVTGPRPYILAGDSLYFTVRSANCGFLPLDSVAVAVRGPFSNDTFIDLAFGEECTIDLLDTWVPADTGIFSISASVNHPDDERHSNDTVYTSVYIHPLRQVFGSIVDNGTGAGISARIYFQFISDTGAVYFDSTFSDSTTGIFSAYLIDSLYRVIFHTEIPYPDPVVDTVVVAPDSIPVIELALLPADLLIVNRDVQARYSKYYVEPLDTLGVSCKVWAPANQGLFPVSRIDEFNNTIIIWYTGRTVIDNVTPTEQESLMQFLDAGGKLLITGQNIGEEISGTIFYNDYLHTCLLNDSVSATKCFPDIGDSLGSGMGKIFTVGGAVNQYSRDAIGPDSFSHQFIYYDSLMTTGAGIWYNDPILNYQIINLGFGLEAVHKPVSWTGYMTRKQVLAHFLQWFGLNTYVAEQKPDAGTSAVLVYPNPARNWLNIQAPMMRSVQVFDAVGRRVKKIKSENAAGEVQWDLSDHRGRRVPSGVYFLVLETGSKTEIKKVIITR